MYDADGLDGVGKCIFQSVTLNIRFEAERKQRTPGMILVANCFRLGGTVLDVELNRVDCAGRRLFLSETAELWLVFQYVLRVALPKHRQKGHLVLWRYS